LEDLGVDGMIIWKWTSNKHRHMHSYIVKSPLYEHFTYSNMFEGLEGHLQGE